jgi:hypothetical protein
LLTENRQTQTYRDEVFYLSRALDPGGLNRARLIPEIITPDRLTPAALKEKDVVFLCHLAVMQPIWALH